MGANMLIPCVLPLAAMYLWSYTFVVRAAIDSAVDVHATAAAL